jgi:hypothetical protein
MDHLAVEITQLHAICVHDAQPTNASGGQIQHRTAAQATGTDHQHRCGAQTLLAARTKRRQDQLSPVALHLSPA